MIMTPALSARIEAIRSLKKNFDDNVIADDTTSALIDAACNYARQLVDAAPQSANPGRIIHAIDMIHASISILDQSIALGAIEAAAAQAVAN